jgi:hypothetical protein
MAHHKIQKKKINTRDMMIEKEYITQPGKSPTELSRIAFEGSRSM